MVLSETLFIGIAGSVIAFRKSDGQRLWSTKPKAGIFPAMQFVNIMLDGSQLFVHTRGELYALDAIRGTILWTDGLEGLGYDIAVMAVQGNHSQQAALAMKNRNLMQEQNNATTQPA